MAIINLIHSRL